METTLAKGLKMLEAIAHSDGPRGVSELGRELGISRSNAHRLLQTLAALGYVRQDQERRLYEPTLRLFELGSAVVAHQDIRTISQPVMRALGRQVDENVILSVRDGSEVVVLDRIEGTRTLRTYTPLGSRNPMHCTSAGKILLAHAPADIVDDVMGSLRKFTAHTIVTAAKLRAELQHIRMQGFAIAQAEWREDVGGVCAPIRQSDGSIAAALGVSGPIGRVNPARIKSLLPQLLAAANDISERLGYSANDHRGRAITR